MADNENKRSKKLITDLQNSTNSINKLSLLAKAEVNKISKEHYDALRKDVITNLKNAGQIQDENNLTDSEKNAVMVELRKRYNDEKEQKRMYEEAKKAIKKFFEDEQKVIEDLDKEYKELKKEFDDFQKNDKAKEEKEISDLEARENDPQKTNPLTQAEKDKLKELKKKHDYYEHDFENHLKIVATKLDVARDTITTQKKIVNEIFLNRFKKRYEVVKSGTGKDKDDPESDNDGPTEKTGETDGETPVIVTGVPVSSGVVQQQGGQPQSGPTTPTTRSVDNIEAPTTPNGNDPTPGVNPGVRKDPPILPFDVNTMDKAMALKCIEAYNKLSESDKMKCFGEGGLEVIQKAIETLNLERGTLSDRDKNFLESFSKDILRDTKSMIKKFKKNNNISKKDLTKLLEHFGYGKDEIKNVEKYEKKLLTDYDKIPDDTKSIFEELYNKYTRESKILEESLSEKKKLLTPDLSEDDRNAILNEIGQIKLEIEKNKEIGKLGDKIMLGKAYSQAEKMSEIFRSKNSSSIFERFFNRFQKTPKRLGPSKDRDIDDLRRQLEAQTKTAKEIAEEYEREISVTEEANRDELRNRAQPDPEQQRGQ